LFHCWLLPWLPVAKKKKLRLLLRLLPLRPLLLLRLRLLLLRLLMLRLLMLLLQPPRLLPLLRLLIPPRSNFYTSEQ
jgi:hypothetical protein